jgi:ParB-like chromosome segregation protein Spo0J
MKVKVSDLKLNESNPRHIKDAKFKQLKKSITDFPEMLNVRPLVVNKRMEVLGGNMRLRAILDLGIEEIDVIITDFTDEQQAEFIIKDNLSFGEWDWDALANEWDTELLEEWGLDIPAFDTDFSGKNAEIDTDAMEEEMTLSFKFKPDIYFQVKQSLESISDIPEVALLKLVENAESQVPI